MLCVAMSQSYKAHQHPDMHGAKGLATLWPRGPKDPLTLPNINGNFKSARKSPRCEKSPLVVKRKVCTPPHPHFSKLGKALCR